MKVALAFSHTPSFIEHKDMQKHGPYDNVQLGFLWLDWVAELGGVEKHELVLLVPQELVLPESVRAWKKLTRLNDRNKVAGWPAGPNISIQQIFWWMTLRKIGEPVFWMESDAIPLKPYWIDTWVEEYARGKKPFMGGFVPDIPDLCPKHMTGIAIYPANAVELAPRLLQAKHSAWDIWAAPEILPKMHATKLLQHAWQHGPITTMEEYKKEIDPEANIFHTDKYGALIGLFRSQRSGTVEEPEASRVIKKVFGVQDSPERPATNEFLPAATAEEDVHRMILDVIKTEPQRTRLVEFLRDHNYLFLNFGKGRRTTEPLALAKAHGRA